MSIFKNAAKVFICFFAVMMPLMGTTGYGQGNQETSAPEKQKKITVSGVVNHVNAIARTMTISGGMGPLTILVPDGTKIVRRFEKLYLDEINTGDSVTVECDISEPGKYVAISIMDSKAL